MRDGECHIWGGAKNSQGYGQVTINGKRHYVHRIMFELHHGNIPPAGNVCHSCDTPLCCNPDHMFLGTQKDNMEDMAKKERSGCRKLTVSDVKTIHRLRGTLTHQQIANAFGVSAVTVGGIFNGRWWKHVSPA